MFYVILIILKIFSFILRVPMLNTHYDCPDGTISVYMEVCDSFLLPLRGTKTKGGTHRK